MKGRMKLDGAVRRKNKIEVSFSKERGLTFSRQTAKILTVNFSRNIRRNSTETLKINIGVNCYRKTSSCIFLILKSVFRS